MHQVERYHDICAGHRVVGHEGKCRHLHGHNYRIHFLCEADTSKQTKELGKSNDLDGVGRVIDFSVIKEKLCMWIENNWDHKFLHWEYDPVIEFLCDSLMSARMEAVQADNRSPDLSVEDCNFGFDSFVEVPFNPTAENMAHYLVTVIGPQQLKGTGVKLVKVTIDETAKCSASYSLK